MWQTERDLAENRRKRKNSIGFWLMERGKDARKCRKIFLEAIFSHSRIIFSKFWLKIFLIISYCVSANHNPELRFVICTGVTPFALMLHLNCIARSQSEASNWSCILLEVTSTIRK